MGASCFVQDVSVGDEGDRAFKSRAASAVLSTRGLLTILRAPIVEQVQVGDRVYQVTIRPLVSAILRPVPSLVCVAGGSLLIGNRRSEGTGSHLWYEVGALLVVVGLLLGIARLTARARVASGEPSAKTRRRQLRAALLVLGLAGIGLAFAVAAADLADILVTVGVAIVAAVVLDGFIVAPAETIFEFELGGPSEIVVSADGVELQKRGSGRELGAKRRSLSLGSVIFSVISKAPVVPARREPSGPTNDTDA